MDYQDPNPNPSADRFQYHACDTGSDDTGRDPCGGWFGSGTETRHGGASVYSVTCSPLPTATCCVSIQ